MFSVGYFLLFLLQICCGFSLLYRTRFRLTLSFRDFCLNMLKFSGYGEKLGETFLFLQLVLFSSSFPGPGRREELRQTFLHIQGMVDSTYAEVLTHTHTCSVGYNSLYKFGGIDSAIAVLNNFIRPEGV